MFQGFTFIFVPIFIYFLTKFLLATTSLDKYLISGITVVSCMPPPGQRRNKLTHKKPKFSILNLEKVSSAVILTKSAGGNDAAAIFNSAFGSFMGIMFTPMLLLALMGKSDRSY